MADFSWVWAGGYAIELLAFLGAEVIKIESKRRPDSPRQFTASMGDTYPDLDASPVFNHLNLNKLSVTINLSKPRGVELARRIAAISDVVAQNMGPEAMKGMGLDYEDLIKVNPDIIYLSSSASGATGPHGRDVGFAPVFAALGGFSSITGYPNGPPALSMGEIDMLCATTSAFAILVALIHKAHTGEGQYIDLSFAEAVSALIGDILLDYTMNEKVQKRQGNVDNIMAPHNCYPCKGEDKWISIAIANDEEWCRFCDVLGKREWIEDKRFSDSYSRWSNQEELDKLVGQWTRGFTNYEAMEVLQQAGIAAVPSFSAEELYYDPHLAQRDVWVKVNHPVMGEQTTLAPPWKLSATQAKITCASPLMGQHNAYVFEELLGLSKAETKKLEEEEVIY